MKNITNLYECGDTTLITGENNGSYLLTYHRFKQYGSEYYGHISYMDTYFNNIMNRPIQLISASKQAKHHIFLTNDNTLHAVGDNECGQLGLGAESLFNESNIDKPMIIKKSFTDSIIDIKAGMQHTLVLTNNGRVYGCGNNFEYQIGLNIKQNYKELTPINIMNNKKIFHINATFATSYFIDLNNILYTCGNNYNGLNGINTTQFEGFKIKSIYSNNIIQFKSIYVGLNHVIGLSLNNNHVYGWGSNEFYQCGYIHSNKDIIKPALILFFKDNNIKIMNIFCGLNHTIIMDYQYKLYFFGNNDSKSFFIKSNKSNIIIPQLIDLTKYFDHKKLINIVYKSEYNHNTKVFFCVAD